MKQDNVMMLIKYYHFTFDKKIKNENVIFQKSLSNKSTGP